MRARAEERLPDSSGLARLDRIYIYIYIYIYTIDECYVLKCVCSNFNAEREQRYDCTVAGAKMIRRPPAESRCAECAGPLCA